MWSTRRSLCFVSEQKKQHQHGQVGRSAGSLREYNVKKPSWGLGRSTRQGSADCRTFW